MPFNKHALLSLSAAGVLAFGVSACGSDSSDGSSASSSDTAAATPQPTPAAEVTDLSKGVDTEVTLDAGFVKALGTLKLTPAPTGKAEITKAGVAKFPITGGNVKYYTPGTVSPYVQGEIDHDGSGLSLTGGSTKVTLTNFKIDPGASVLTGQVSVNGKVAAASAPLFFLDGRTLKPLATGPNNTAILEGTTVKLKQEAADLLNQTFKTDALKAGLVIGVAKITVKTA
ncbi:MAG: hypothetical protein AAGC46_05805 [Solirubrobacteraceae bacterium]|nr:hypothetical protein [Patulibacter sp.]